MNRLLTAALVLTMTLPALALADPTEGVTVTVDQVEPVNVGDSFVITYRFGYPEGTKLYFPDQPSTGTLERIKVESTTPRILGTGTAETHSLTLMAVRLGKTEISPLDVPVVGPDGETGVIKTPGVEITVVSTLGNENDPQPAQFGEPVNLVVRNDLLLWIVGALLVAAIAAAAGIFAYRRYRAWVLAHTPPPPPEPPEVTAYRRLAEIESMGLIEGLRFKELALLVSEVVREFLGARLGFPGTDSTTWETLDFVRQVAGEGGAGTLKIEELEDFLSLCDLIKFAKFQPSAQDGASLLQRGRGIVSSAMTGVVTSTPVNEPAVPATTGGDDEI